MSLILESLVSQSKRADKSDYHVHLSNFYFLILVLNAFRDFDAFISSGTNCQVFGPRNDMVS